MIKTCYKIDVSYETVKSHLTKRYNLAAGKLALRVDKRLFFGNFVVV